MTREQTIKLDRYEMSTGKEQRENRTKGPTATDTKADRVLPALINLPSSSLISSLPKIPTRCRKRMPRSRLKGMGASH